MEEHVVAVSCPSIKFIVSRLFDATLGFPGEGHKRPKKVTMFTANIGSLKTNVVWKSFACDLCCIQETRIGLVM